LPDAIRDEEDLLVRLRDYVRLNINDRITAINTEKATHYIEPIPNFDRNFVFAGETLDLPNGIFVQFAIEGQIEVRNNRGNFISVPQFIVEVAFDNPKKPGAYFQSLRYMRALYEILVNFETSVIEADGLEITKLVPMTVTLQGRQLIVSGVGVSVAIG